MMSHIELKLPSPNSSVPFSPYSTTPCYCRNWKISSLFRLKVGILCSYYVIRSKLYNQSQCATAKLSRYPELWISHKINPSRTHILWSDLNKLTHNQLPTTLHFLVSNIPHQSTWKKKKNKTIILKIPSIIHDFWLILQSLPSSTLSWLIITFIIVTLSYLHFFLFAYCVSLRTDTPHRRTMSFHPSHLPLPPPGPTIQRICIGNL